jgi:DNA-binding PucR family transcriptional regulator
LVEAAGEKGFRIKVGISTPSSKGDALRQHYQQAVDALTAAISLDQGNRQVWAYDDLGFLGDLLSSSPDTRVSNRYIAILQEIKKYDDEKNTRYLVTLETYLDHLASPNQAAKILFIHRNTLYQRLSKITDLWGIDFQDPLMVLNFNLAVKDWRLHRAR